MTKTEKVNPALKGLAVKVSDLHEDPRNARKHDDRNLHAIKRSLDKFGQQKPIVAMRDGTVIAGNGTLRAAIALGWEKIAVSYFDGKDKTAARAYAIADNRSAELALWDATELKATLKALEKDGIDLDDLAFSEKELAAVMKDLGEKSDEIVEDEAPEPPAKPVTQTGDLWVMGAHRLLCGDSTKAEDVGRVMDKEHADCVFTSPPYAVGIDYGTYKDTLDNLRAMLDALVKLWLSVVMDGGFAVVNFADIVSSSLATGAKGPCEYPMALEYWPRFRSVGWVLWSRRAWCKPNPRVHSPWCIQSNRAATDWEHVWTWKAPGKAVVARVDGKYASANGWFDTSREDGVAVGKEEHGAGMAVGAAARMLMIHSRKGMIIHEPFCGTGTTLIAAEQLSRRCFGLELEPRYCDVIVKRWQNLTGKRAVNETRNGVVIA